MGRRARLDGALVGTYWTEGLIAGYWRPLVGFPTFDLARIALRDMPPVSHPVRIVQVMTIRLPLTGTYDDPAGATAALARYLGTGLDPDFFRPLGAPRDE